MPLITGYTYPEPPSLSVWRRLRQLRTSPPGLVPKHSKRPPLFNSALEQSEQLFTASAQTDYAVRPILLFYGLSQAGRAIGAAMVESNGGKLVNHGLKCSNLSAGPNLAALQLEPVDGAFRELCVALDGAAWTRTVALGTVWGAIPELRTTPMSPTFVPPALRLQAGASSDAATWITVSGVSTAILSVSSDANEAERAAALDAVPGYLRKHYPALRLLQDPVVQLLSHEAVPTLMMSGRVQDSEGSWVSAYRTMRGHYRGEHWAFPDVGAADRAPHPLMLWWALLFALSMRARYEPVSWLRDLDVNINPLAATLEHALDLAVTTVPALVAELFTELASS